MSASRRRLLILLGPTAVGKTDYSITLARKHGSPVISCDARQIFRQMAIGTAVPSSEQLRAVPHHFIQTVPVDCAYTAGDYELEAVSLLERLFDEGHETLVMTGGSMFYIDAVCRGLDDLPDGDPVLRRELWDRLRTEGVAPLAEELHRLDPATYAVITNDFLADGGDTYYAFAASSAQFDTSIPMDEAVMDYIKTELNGSITAAKYGKVDDRITIIADPLKDYKDVDATLWYAAALRYVITNKAMIGVGEGQFAPNAKITRAMVMKLIANMAGAAEETTQAEGDAKWYDKTVAWAIANNISDGSRPDEDCTREEFAFMLYNYLKSQGKGYTGLWMTAPLTNPGAADISEEATEAMYWMVNNKVINGMDEAGTLAPQDTTTRAQIAQMLLNLSTVPA